jgi:hypothetical protein
MLAALTEVLNSLPTVADPDDRPPATVQEGALWVHDWINMEADLAELTFDSQHQPELAGTRASSSLRELTFVGEAYTVEMEIEPGPRTMLVSGTIEPPTAGTVQLIVGGEVFGGPISDAGAFTITDVAEGTALAFVETASGKVRLGSFEL